jgi:hypothetical protein
MAIKPLPRELYFMIIDLVSCDNERLEERCWDHNYIKTIFALTKTCHVFRYYVLEHNKDLCTSHFDGASWGPLKDDHPLLNLLRHAIIREDLKTIASVLRNKNIPSNVLMDALKVAFRYGKSQIATMMLNDGRIMQNDKCYWPASATGEKYLFDIVMKFGTLEHAKQLLKIIPSNLNSCRDYYSCNVSTNNGGVIMPGFISFSPNSQIFEILFEYLTHSSNMIGIVLFDNNELNALNKLTGISFNTLIGTLPVYHKYPPHHPAKIESFIEDFTNSCDLDLKCIPFEPNSKILRDFLELKKKNKSDICIIYGRNELSIALRQIFESSTSSKY